MPIVPTKWRKSYSSKKAAAKKKASGDSGPRWPPRLTIGDVPVVDEVERTYPSHVCVLFRALAQRLAALGD